jgi:HK97 gp10 family phage protein
MARKWVDLTGVKELRAAIAAIPVEERKAIRKVVRETGRKIRDAAKARAPRDSGDLVKSITSKSSKSGMAAKIGTDIVYGPYVEFGTSDTAAKPFLFPSLEEQRPHFDTDMRQALDAANKAAAKK